jgi:hypothetical protein
MGQCLSFDRPKGLYKVFNDGGFLEAYNKIQPRIAPIFTDNH